MNIKNFEVGNIYEMRYVGDSQLKPQFICVKVTDKTATFERFGQKEKPISRRIKTNSEGVQYIVDGNYSMAPSITAVNIIG